MATKAVRVGFRLTVLLGIAVVGFYIGRPLYWKLSATLHDIREKDYTKEAVQKGFSDLIMEAHKTVWGSTTKDEQDDHEQVAHRKSLETISANNAKAKFNKLSAPSALTSEPKESLKMLDIPKRNVDIAKQSSKKIANVKLSRNFRTEEKSRMARSALRAA